MSDSAAPARPRNSAILAHNGSTVWQITNGPHEKLSQRAVPLWGEEILWASGRVRIAVARIAETRGLATKCHADNIDNIDDVRAATTVKIRAPAGGMITHRIEDRSATTECDSDSDHDIRDIDLPITSRVAMAGAEAIADVADSILIGVGLIEIRDCRAVVAHVADAFVVGIVLTRVRRERTVI